jgi:hypothetical protein
VGLVKMNKFVSYLCVGNSRGLKKNIYIYTHTHTQSSDAKT